MKGSNHEGRDNTAISRVIERFPHLERRLGGMPYVGIEEDAREFSSVLVGVKDGFEILAEVLADWQPGDYNFTNGNPLPVKGFQPCIDAMKECLDSTALTRYPYSEGDDTLRLKVLEYVESLGIKNDSPYEYDDIRESGLSINNLTFTTSTSEGFRNVIRMIANHDDVILTTGPNYGLFSLRTEWNRSTLRVIETYEEDDWLVNPKILEAKILEINDELALKAKNEGRSYIPKVVGFVNTNPNNPLGTVMDYSKLDLAKEIVRVCKENGVFIIDDLIYQDIVFDEENKPLPLATIDGAFSNVITLMGLSKSYGFAGLRAGIVVADEVIVRQMINKIFRYSDATSHLSAVALAAAFNDSAERKEAYTEYFSNLRKMYTDRLDLINGLINGISAIKSDEVKTAALSCIENLKIRESEKRDLMRGIDGIKIAVWPKAGYFIVLDLNVLKGTRYYSEKSGEYVVIDTEEKLLRYFYEKYKIRYLPGISIIWPNRNDFVARFTFAKSFEELVEAFYVFKCGVDNLLERGRDL